MTKKILTTVAVFALLSTIVIGVVSASPSRQQSETARKLSDRGSQGRQR